MHYQRSLSPIPRSQDWACGPSAFPNFLFLFIYLFIYFIFFYFFLFFLFNFLFIYLFLSIFLKHFMLIIKLYFYKIIKYIFLSQ